MESTQIKFPKIKHNRSTSLNNTTQHCPTRKIGTPKSQRSIGGLSTSTHKSMASSNGFNSVSINPFTGDLKFENGHIYQKPHQIRGNSQDPFAVKTEKIEVIAPREALELKMMNKITDVQYQTLIKKYNGEQFDF